MTEEVFSLGLKQVLNINTPMFQNDTENLSSTQIEMLKAIADGEQHFSSQAVKQVYNLGNPNTIVKNKKILQNKDIIEKQKADLYLLIRSIVCGLRKSIAKRQKRFLVTPVTLMTLVF